MIPARAVFVLFDESENIPEIVEFLKPTGRPIKIFQDKQATTTYIQQPFVKENSIILIISVLNAYQLRLELNGYRQIHTIYINSDDTVHYETWISRIKKVSNEETSMSDRSKMVDLD